MRILIVLLVLASFAGADVISGTLHYSDACEVDDLMESVGVYDGRVKIVNFQGHLTYAVEFPGEYFSWDSSSDMNRVSATIISVAMVSEGTSWHSDFVICLFEDDTVGMFTADARTALRYSNSGYDSTDFLANNIITGERSLSQLDI